MKGKVHSTLPLITHGTLLRIKSHLAKQYDTNTLVKHNAIHGRPKIVLQQWSLELYYHGAKT
jgi:hypothetical protein